MAQRADHGFAAVNGAEIYWESYEGDGTPVIVLHGGFGLIGHGREPQVGGMSGALIDRLAARRQVIGIELQGHGHTADIDRPFSYEAFGDDVAGVITELGIERADVVGYSLGAGAALRAAVQHPDRIRKLAAVSIPYRRDGWFPEVLGAMDHMSGAGFAHMKQTPIYAAYAAVAPDPDAFPTLMDKTGELQRTAYDWSDDVRALTTQTLLVFADADSVPLTHIAEFYALLGGGVRDASWDASARPQAQLAVLPGVTHYDIFQSMRVATVLDEFLG